MVGSWRDLGLLALLQGWGKRAGSPSPLWVPSLPPGCLQSLTQAGASWGRQGLTAGLPCLDLGGIAPPKGQRYCKRGSPLTAACCRPKSRAKAVSGCSPGASFLRGGQKQEAAPGQRQGGKRRLQPNAHWMAGSCCHVWGQRCHSRDSGGHCQAAAFPPPSRSRQGSGKGSVLGPSCPARTQLDPHTCRHPPWEGAVGHSPCFPPSPKATLAFYNPFIYRHSRLKPHLGASTEQQSTAPAPGTGEPRPAQLLSLLQEG